MSDDDGINSTNLEKLAYGGEDLNCNAPSSFAAPHGSAAYDSFKSAIESGDIEHLLWWSATARALIAEVVQQHADKDSPEYNECDTSRCMWCEMAAKLMPPNDD